MTVPCQPAAQHRYYHQGTLAAATPAGALH
jgi:hypothetical protein